jgi:hypothetical protein
MYRRMQIDRPFRAPKSVVKGEITCGVTLLRSSVTSGSQFDPYSIHVDQEWSCEGGLKSNIPIELAK